MLTVCADGGSCRTPAVRAVRVVRRRVELHGSLAAIVHGAGRILVLGVDLGIAVLDVLDVDAIDRDLPADRADLHHGLAVVDLTYLASMALPLACSDEHLLALERIATHPVHAGNTASVLLLQMLSAEDLDVARLFHKEPIGLVEVLVPEEDSLLVDESNGAALALEGPTNDLDDVLKRDGAPLAVKSCHLVALVASVLLLVDLA